MTFAYPWVLLFLSVPVLLLVWMFQRRSWGVVLPVDHRDLPDRRLLSVLLRVLELVPQALFAITILILAKPQTLQVPSEERILSNISICMDVSFSMATDNRYQMAKQALEEFIDTRHGDALGFTLFGTRQIRWTPLTKDIATIRRALPFADPLNQPSFMGGTMIGAALRFCRDNLVREATEGDRLLILVSDGFSADVNDENVSDFIDEMKQASITVYHIHVGTDQAPSAVMDLANGTGGESFVATDSGGLKRIFRHIDRMKPARFKPSTAIPMDFYQPFGLAGLCLMAVYCVAAFGLRYTPW
jgi:Ca-activated chloride channel homolog